MVVRKTAPEVPDVLDSRFWFFGYGNIALHPVQVDILKYLKGASSSALVSDNSKVAPVIVT